jgi:hypothetical protein
MNYTLTVINNPVFDLIVKCTHHNDTDKNNLPHTPFLSHHTELLSLLPDITRPGLHTYNTYIQHVPKRRTGITQAKHLDDKRSRKWKGRKEVSIDNHFNWELETKNINIQHWQIEPQYTINNHIFPSVELTE